MTKTLLPTLAFILCVSPAQAQLPKPGLPSSAFTENLSKITQAFRNNYYEIQADPLPAQEDMDVYKSAVTLPGAQHCVIYRFHSKTDTTASWQALMYSGDNYKAALKAYKTACRQVDKCKVRINNTVAAFSGKIDEPDTDLRFVSTIFTLNTKDSVYGNFYAEVELVNITFDQWEVHINLQNKKDDDEK